ncbi:MAG TPA: LLM class F420-dependent oxidoreductase [Chloroflexota bacterium]|nr:LLM class F420-dependent oxidoreductase [Chloroflexota bacterium]
MEIGRIGVWTFEFEQHPWSAVAEAAAELDELGYAAIWFPESRGREVMAQSALLLGATKRAVIAPGIANLYARDAMSMAAGQRTLCEAFPGRYLLGIGVSHRPSVEQIRGHVYGPPLATMRAYLDAMDAATYLPPRAEPEPRVLAALGPRMLKLSAERSLGAHPYFVPVEHTAIARQTMGDGPLLAPEQAVVLERDAGRAREIARAHMTRYLAAENYTNNLRRLGFTENDVANGGSDKLVDAIVAWGSLEDVVARVQAHLDTGADHVCIQVLPSQPGTLPKQEWRELASALLS